MRNVLFLVIAIVDVIANIPYVLDTFKGKSKPNIATWSTWTLLNLITVISALAAGGALNTAVLAGAFLVGNVAILSIGIFKGTRRYTLFDGFCQAMALTGVILWQLSNNPNIALLFVILVDCIAIIPTYRHAYLYPREETLVTYAVSGMVALALTALATSHSFAALAVTIESALINIVLVGLILYRGTKQSA